MPPELPAGKRSGTVLTGVGTVPGGSDPLMRFRLDPEAGPGYHCGLEYLGGRLRHEIWEVDGPVECGREGDMVWHQSGSLLFLALEVPDDGRTDPAQPVHDAYVRLLAMAARRGCGWLLRAWNYLPAINAGEGDRERYRRFCLGRASALERAGFGPNDLCAGTAIGGDDPNLRVFLLCGSQPGVSIENPRQVSAYLYPRIYGPRSPSFARATALARNDDSALLMISGTASVVGHRTLHDGDAHAQLEEIVHNIEMLLAESAQRLERPGLAALGRDSRLRVYVRHAADWPAIETRLKAIWPDTPVAGLRGDICRSDLLLEIEAVTPG